MNIASAKTNMIKQQLRPSGILDESILTLFAKIPRESFAPEAYRELAYIDTMIPLGENQVMLSPVLEAKIIEALNLKKTDKVLEVGTGSGYLTALLAQKSQHVYSVDSHSTHLEDTQKKLSELHIANVSLQVNDASTGWSKQQPYDAIVITGSLDFLPKNFLEQLTIGGRLFTVINRGPAMLAYLITRKNEQAWTHHRLFETAIPPLANALKKSKFKF